MKVPDRDVMRLFDGELESEEWRRVAEARRSDPSVNARLAGLLQVGAFTRAWARGRQERSSQPTAQRWESTLGVRVALGSAVLALAALFVLPRLGGGEPIPQAAASREVPAGVVAVEQVDFGAHAGTIFSVSAAGTETLVVWLSDDADESTLAL